MKTTVLFRMIVLVAMVFAGIANTTVKAQGNNFITNEEKVDDLVVSKVIYRLDGSLYRHMKYDFTSPAKTTCPVVTRVSQATFEFLSYAKNSSSKASDI